MFDELMLRVGSRFGRVEPRRRARGVRARAASRAAAQELLTIAEQAAETTPDGMRYLLERARWDADRVRDDVRGYVIEHLGDPGAVLRVDLCRSWNYAEASAA